MDTVVFFLVFCFGRCKQIMSENADRLMLVNKVFPDGVPPLWCPTLSHFHSDGSIDAERTARHLRHISPSVKGILVPGSTGEGWDMSDDQVRELLDIVLPLAHQLDLHVLIGVLREKLDEMLTVTEATVSWLCREYDEEWGMAALMDSGVAGFTVCPPSGAELSARRIRGSLKAVLELGRPTVLYQLPQVTGNEMTPECVAELAAEYPNFLMLKDSSGTDRIALAGMDLEGVFLVRGAEGQYHQWLKAAGGPYDGYLLSTANCFAERLRTVIEVSETRIDEAARLARPIEDVIQACFQIVDGYSAANPFTNANKIIDQVMAFGDEAVDMDAPYLAGGKQLPAKFVKQAWEVLDQKDLVPREGYG